MTQVLEGTDCCHAQPVDLPESRRLPEPAPTLPELALRAMVAFQRGELGEAEDLCRRTLEANPKDAQALHLLGIIAAQTSRLDVASEWFARAADARPESERAWLLTWGLRSSNWGGWQSP